MTTRHGSVDTILTYNKNDVQSDWSVVWSTSHIPGMDNARGAGPHRSVGRRRLRFGSLALGCCLCMHCRVSATVLSGGFFTVMLFFFLAIVVVGNPLRHFEVYLGQWSLSGPGRAFRIIPMLDGIGIAICINAIIRAICYCCLASILILYVHHSVMDTKLPFTHCRDLNLQSYEPRIKLRKIIRVPKETNYLRKMPPITRPNDLYTVGVVDHAWRNPTPVFFAKGFKVLSKSNIEFCNENISDSYPPLFTTPAHNFFYIEVMKIHPKQDSPIFNWKLLIVVTVMWLLIWFMMIYEKCVYGKIKSEHQLIEHDILDEEIQESPRSGSRKQYYKTNNEETRTHKSRKRCNDMQVERDSTKQLKTIQTENKTSENEFDLFCRNLAIQLTNMPLQRALICQQKLLSVMLIWNNVHPLALAVPWVWVIVLMGAVSYHFATTAVSVSDRVFMVDSKEFLYTVADAVIMAMYVHSASIGTELIHGKGLNHYASGHIDPHLHGENIWHSVFLLILTGIHSFGASVCAVVQKGNIGDAYEVRESSLWTIPIYSRCAIVGDYSHFIATLLFLGLTFAYATAAFLLLKSALHTIFEYRVKLVFMEQYIVGGLIIACMLLSSLFTLKDGLVLLECVDAMMTGIAMPLVCVLQLIGLLFVYRSRDFMSDIAIATEENTCSTRIGIQWQILPFIIIVSVCCKIASFVEAEMPVMYILIALVPVLAVLVSPPIRACHNAIVFMRPAPRRET